LLSAICEIA